MRFSSRILLKIAEETLEELNLKSKILTYEGWWVNGVSSRVETEIWLEDLKKFHFKLAREISSVKYPSVNGVEVLKFF